MACVFIYLFTAVAHRFSVPFTADQTTGSSSLIHLKLLLCVALKSIASIDMISSFVAACRKQAPLAKRQRIRPDLIFACGASAAPDIDGAPTTATTCTSRPLRKRYSSQSQSPGVVLYDSLTSSYQPLSVSDDSGLGVMCYTCGPTVYDSAHLGHARTYVTLDLVRRAILVSHASLPPDDRTPPPLFVMNVTDVDDKILKRAREVGQDPLKLARKFEAEFWEDMDSLNVMRPDVVTRVTENVDDTIVPYIAQIMDNGFAYILPDGNDSEGDESGKGDGKQASSVYFDVAAFESAQGGLNKYGKLAPSAAAAAASTEGDFFSWDAAEKNVNATSTQRGKRRKRDARDFVLWKGQKEGEELYWNSPWGPGRPGWHIECSAMIESVAQSFASSHKMAIHAGGIDLKFPHHTNEIAQAEAYHMSNRTACNEDGKEWISHWIHTGHLHIKGKKMSKSLKNFVTIRQLLSPSTADGNDSNSLASPSDDFRLWCLGISGSYRGPATYSEARIHEARKIREKIVRFLVDGEQWILKSQAEHLAPTGLWREGDMELSRLTASCALSCKVALMGSTRAKGAFDIDGAKYLSSIIELVESGLDHIAEPNDGSIPVEPLRSTLATIREMLSIIGFTDKTVKAGMSLDDGSVKSNIKGGEEALLDELADFRSQVRAAALSAFKAKGNEAAPKEALKEILQCCDNIRDRNLPRIGVEILDAAAASSTKADKNQQAAGRWRFCLPKSVE